MLVQRRPKGRLRLIGQHEHGLVSGELAAAWRLPGNGGRLAPTVVLATSLHDLGWRDLDRVPRWNPRTGLPHDFLTFPVWEKYQGAVEGIDRVAELHPYSGVLVSLHYSELGKDAAPAEFLEEEEKRRGVLLRSLDEDAPRPEAIRADLGHLQLLDHLSLFLCLASPDAVPGSLPGWLSGGRFRAVDERGALSARWTASDRIELNPGPFEEGDVELEVTYRDLTGAPYESEGALIQAWRTAETGVWRIGVTSG